jgi:hypothetical protein
MKWLRWKLALFLDRYPDTCWADLVMWAVYPELHPFAEIFQMRGTIGQCERAGCTPYCGKCATAVEGELRKVEG